MLAVLMPSFVTLFDHLFEQMFSAMEKLLGIIGKVL